MSKKIQITEEQERLINSLSGIREIVLMVFIEDGGYKENYKPLNKFTFDELARLFYEPNSYEVIPEFNKGDWIVYENSYHKCVMQIISVDTTDIEVEQYHEGFIDNNIISLKSPLIRHATQSEIEQEKQRRFWHENGRSVWELMKDDIIFIEDDVEQVMYSDDCSVVTSKYDREKLNVKDNAYVVCFGMNREDIKVIK